MIVTGAFFADNVEVVDNKANITGAIHDYVRLDGPETVWTTNLFMALQADSDDVDAKYAIVIEVITPDGTSAGTRTEVVPPGVHSGENRFYFMTLPLAFTNPGRHVFLVTVGGATVSVPIRIDF